MSKQVQMCRRRAQRARAHNDHEVLLGQYKEAKAWFEREIDDNIGSGSWKRFVTKELLGRNPWGTIYTRWYGRSSNLICYKRQFTRMMVIQTPCKPSY